MSRIESDKLPFLFAPFDCRQLLQETADSQHIIHHRHRIVYDGDTAPVMIDGDKDRIEQVLINLISNAIKYSPNANSIIIHAKEEADNFHISVQDFGIGIPAGINADIFSRFYRVEGLSPSFPGLGIGLYVSSEIVKAHKGNISYTSEEGKGSTFTITLPLIINR